MDDAAVALTRHKLDVDAFYRMAEAGILAQDDRVELIDGELIDMRPIGTDHAATVNGLTRTLVMACGTQAIVRVQNPIRLDRFNEPQPDVAVVRPRADNYRSGGHPTAPDVLLLAEVADSSLRFDREVKLPLYARFGITELWIVDLVRRKLDAYRNPAGDEYAAMHTYVTGDRITFGIAPKIELTIESSVFD